MNQHKNVYPLGSDYYSVQAVLNQAIPSITFDHIGTVQILLKNENTGHTVYV